MGVARGRRRKGETRGIFFSLSELCDVNILLAIAYICFASAYIPCVNCFRAAV